MVIPNELTDQLKLLSIHVQHDERHALGPWHRQQVYSKLFAQTPRGATICGWLAVLCAQRVLPFWEAAKPHDHGPRELIELSMGYLRGSYNYDSMQGMWKKYEDRFGVEAIAEFIENEPWQTWRAALAAAATIYEVKAPHPFLNLILSQHDTDHNIDPWSHDAALWAMECEAGAEWEDPDSSKRLSFWTWWLNEAIPIAWSKCESQD